MDGVNWYKSKRDEIMAEKDMYLYNFSSNTKVGTSWRCRNRDCPGRLKINAEKTSIIAFIDHNHEPNIRDYVSLKIQNKIKIQNNDKNSRTKKFDDFLEDIAVELPKIELEHIPNIENLRDIYNKKQDQQLKLQVAKYNDIPEELHYCIDKSIFVTAR